MTHFSNNVTRERRAKLSTLKLCTFKFENIEIFYQNGQKSGYFRCHSNQHKDIQQNDKRLNIVSGWGSLFI
jgi:hypothetical protein